MDTLECIRTRRSVRRFLDLPVEMEKVGHLLEAAQHAPSSGNLQNWAFILVKDQANRTAVAEACLRQMWIASAPLIIVVCAQLEKGEKFYGLRGERLYNIQNCAAAAENILLAANAVGLAGCWIGGFEEDMLARACGIPDNVRPQVVLPIGYPASVPDRPTRNPITHITYLEKYGSAARIADIPFSALGYTGHFVTGTVEKAKDAVLRMHKKLKKE